MFKSKKNSSAENAGISNEVNHIASGTKVIGDIISKGNFRLDGELEGNLVSESRVVLGESSVLAGSLKSLSAEVAGAINGKIEISEELSLRKTAVINADIIIGSLEVDSGAVINGTTKMSAQKDYRKKDGKAEKTTA